MDAIILCAGFGTRMYPLTKTCPKPLLKVAGKPVLDYLFSQLLGWQGLKSIHIATNKKYYQDFVEWGATWQGEMQKMGMEIQIHNNGVENNETRLGAIGDLEYVLRNGNLYNRDVLIIAGDNIFLFDLLPVWEKFISSSQNLLLAIKEMDRERLQQMGVLEIGDDNKVIRFQEKPQRPTSYWVCPAFYFLTADATRLIGQYLETTNSKDAIGHFIQYLVSMLDVYAYPSPGRRLDIGSMEDYKKANMLLTKNDGYSI